MMGSVIGFDATVDRIVVWRDPLGRIREEATLKARSICLQCKDPPFWLRHCHTFPTTQASLKHQVETYRYACMLIKSPRMYS